MKNKLLIILCLLMCLSLNSCSSCNKEEEEFNNVIYGEVDFYVAGIYVRVDESAEMNINDGNPKVYFNFADKEYFGSFLQKTGYGASAVQYGEGQKSVSTREGRDIYYCLSRMVFVNKNVSKVTLYQIRINSKDELYIYEDVSVSIELEEKYTYKFNTKFDINNKKIGLDMRLSFSKES